MNSLTTAALLTDLARTARKALNEKHAAAAALNSAADSEYDRAVATYTETRAGLIVAMRSAGVASLNVDGQVVVDASADRRDDHLEGEPISPSLMFVPIAA